MKQKGVLELQLARKSKCTKELERKQLQETCAKAGYVRERTEKKCYLCKPRGAG